MCLREKIGPDPRNFNQRVSLGRNDLLIRTFLDKLRVKDYHSTLEGEEKVNGRDSWKIERIPFLRML
jgi:hypothetical protein